MPPGDSDVAQPCSGERSSHGAKIKRHEASSKEDGVTEQDAPLKEMPGEMKREVRELLSITGAGFSGPVFPPYLDKINEQHISQVLEIASKETDHAFRTKSFELKSGVYFFTMILIGAGLLTLYLVPKDIVFYKEILKSVALLAGGFGGGYGYKAYRDKKNQ